MSEALRIETRGPVAHVTLSRPDVHNAFDDKLVAALRAAADHLAAENAVRVVVLGGEGKSFCAGADLNWMKRMVTYTRAENEADSLAMAEMFHAWNTLPKPVVGRIHGAAIGGGTGLVAVCDIAVAAAEAVFAFSEVRLGILPAVISPFVVAKIGVSAARDLFLTGSRFSADRARSIGLVHHVVDAEAIDDAVERRVHALLAGGPLAQARAKTLIAEIAGHDPAEVRTLTARVIAEARAGDEGQDGMAAFLERRKPGWQEER